MKRFGASLLLITLLLSGCFYPKGTPAATGIYEPVHIADANVPLVWRISPGHFDRVTEVERDSYGRGYYIYRPPSGIYGTYIKVHIISQSVKDGQVLYYPDICYWIQQEEGEPPTQEQIDQLKLLNDWNLPIKEEKAYCVSNTEKHEDIAYEEDICEAVRYFLKLDESYIVACNGMEYKNRHEQLLFVSVYHRAENETQDEEQTYFLMVYCDTLYRPIIASQQVDDPLDMQEQIIRFRAEWMAKEE